MARDVALVNGLFVETGCMNQIMHQFAIKNLAKAEFLLGVALNMCDVVNSRAENVQNLLAEMINTVELVRAAIRAAEVDHVPGPAGPCCPTPSRCGPCVCCSRSFIRAWSKSCRYSGRVTW